MKTVVQRILIFSMVFSAAEHKKARHYKSNAGLQSETAIRRAEKVFQSGTAIQAGMSPS